MSKSLFLTKHVNHKFIQPFKQFKASPGQDQSSDCSDCVAGKYNAEAGASACIDCSAGRFKGSAGQDEASDCDGLCAAGKVRRIGI